MAFCTTCGAQVKGAFCEQCGTPVSAAGGGAAPPQMSPPQMSPAPMSAAAPQMQTKRTNPLVWILLGVLGFIAICFVGCVVTVGYFASRPAKTLARIITATNPNAEVLSTDDDAKTFRIRDRRTGEEFTMSFNDVQNGKFKMRAIGRNGEVANVEIGAGAGKVPSWVPTYPGAKAQGNFTANGDDGSGHGAGGLVSYESSDSPDRVFDFYKEKVNGLGMKVVNQISAGDTNMIMAQDSDEKRYLQVAINKSSSGGSTIGITFGEKK